MNMAYGCARLSVAVLMVAGLTACADSPGDSTGRSPAPLSSAPRVAASAGIGGAPSAAVTPGPVGGSPSAVPATVPANATTKVTEAQFHLPSKNIGCYLSAELARCDIAKRSWTPPPAPASCEFDWAFGVAVEQNRKANLTCAGDTVLGGADELAYGRSLRAGDIVCDSLSTGVHCANLATRHGFTLSVQRYELF
ncbi:DUF6636 domain-containing protein [Krasilnikovia sp. MM14-A1004]|uniref:DUF6636 domain-containing protein n=1 Tax=Krasilnikovia sp. MM14-A1004 TaxID=3373541 RepID=UPI00399C5F2F